MPVLAVGGANSVVGGPNINTSSVVYGVHGIVVPNSGHWIPQFVIKMLHNFFGGNTTKTK